MDKYLIKFYNNKIIKDELYKYYDINNYYNINNINIELLKEFYNIKINKVNNIIHFQLY